MSWWEGIITPELQVLPQQEALERLQKEQECPIRAVTTFAQCYRKSRQQAGLEAREWPSRRTKMIITTDRLGFSSSSAAKCRDLQPVKIYYCPRLPRSSERGVCGRSPIRQERAKGGGSTPFSLSQALGPSQGSQGWFQRTLDQFRQGTAPSLPSSPFQCSQLPDPSSLTTSQLDRLVESVYSLNC